MSDEVTFDPSVYPTLNQFVAPLAAPVREILGRETDKNTVRASLERPELSNVILLAPPGSGKALVNGTPIAVNSADGYKAIEDLVVGDEVFDEYGEVQKVEGVFPQGEKDVFHMEFADDSSMMCNDEHLWTAFDTINGAWFTKTLAEIMELGLETDDGEPRWYIHKAGAVQRDFTDRSLESLSIDPFVLGSILACPIERVFDEEGHCVGWGIDYDLPKESAALLEDEDKNVLVERLAGVHVETHPNGYIRRFITEPYFNAPVETRAAVLAGFVSTAGNVIVDDEGCYRVGLMVTDAGLLTDLKRLIHSLGLFVEVSTSIDINRNNIDAVTYTLFISGRQSMMDHIVVDSDAKKIMASHPAPEPEEAYEVVAITDAMKLGAKADMTCIKVSGESELFQAGFDHVVTHNTVLVQAVMMDDPRRKYFEVDLAKMVSSLDNPVQMSGLIKQLFNEAERYSKTEGQDIVLFIDEFHQIVMLSPAAVEALKPVLAASGRHGILIVAATTEEEYNDYIAPNLPLKERLQPVKLAQVDQKTTVDILWGMAKRYSVDHLIPDNSLFNRIYELTKRYLPMSVQPRQSISVLDGMIGWHRLTGRPFDDKLLGDVLMQSTGVNIALRVDGTAIRDYLNSRVLAQERATDVINKRLQICVADLHDKRRPMASFLFTGSTGVGKNLSNDTLVPVYAQDKVVRWKRHGDLEVGDYVFNREGKPVAITGVYPQPEQTFYRVCLANGRHLDAGAEHLWTVRRDDEGDDQWQTITTKELLDIGYHPNGSRKRYEFPVNKWLVPASGGVSWPESTLDIDPYVVGAFVSSGVLRSNVLTLRHSDEEVVYEVARRLGSGDPKRVGNGNNWVFPLTDELRDRYKDFGAHSRSMKYIQSAMVFGGFDEIFNALAKKRRIPRDYMEGSREQRWDLIQGLFDTGGYIRKQGYTVHYQSMSHGLLEDIHYVLASVGVDSTISEVRRGGKDDNNDVIDKRLIVHIDQKNKPSLFGYNESKRSVAGQAYNKSAHFTYNYEAVEIESITALPSQVGQCIMVDDEEHLYQAGEFVVTHNTEMVVQLSKMLYGDDDTHLVRFDMSEFAEEKMVTPFRKELTRAVANKGHCLILYDEIEKAHPSCYRLLLQVLDAGHLSDENGREVTFLNTYNVLTTNVGSSIFQTIGDYASSDTGDGSAMEDFEAKIESTLRNEKFPPELLGRVDAIVPFQPLSIETKRRIIQNKLDKLVIDVRDKHGVSLFISKKVLQYLAEDVVKTNTDSGGARESVRLLNNEVTSAVATFLNAYPEVQRVGVGISGEMRSENKKRRKSGAEIQVGRYTG